jgi:hypothetical protein
VTGVALTATKEETNEEEAERDEIMSSSELQRLLTAWTGQLRYMSASGPTRGIEPLFHHLIVPTRVTSSRHVIFVMVFHDFFTYGNGNVKQE